MANEREHASNRPALTVALLLLSACGSKTDSPAATVTDNATADMTSEGPGLPTRLFGGGKPMPLDTQQQAANGTILYITSIQAKPTETVLGVKVVNGFLRSHPGRCGRLCG